MGELGWEVVGGEKEGVREDTNLPEISLPGTVGACKLAFCSFSSSWL